MFRKWAGGGRDGAIASSYLYHLYLLRNITNSIEFHSNTGMRMGEGGEGGWIFSHPKFANAFMNITNNGSVI